MDDMNKELNNCETEENVTQPEVTENPSAELNPEVVEEVTVNPVPEPQTEPIVDETKYDPNGAGDEMPYVRIHMSGTRQTFRSRRAVRRVIHSRMSFRAAIITIRQIQAARRAIRSRMPHRAATIRQIQAARRAIRSRVPHKAAIIRQIQTARAVTEDRIITAQASTTRTGPEEDLIITARMLTTARV